MVLLVKMEVKFSLCVTLLFICLTHANNHSGSGDKVKRKVTIKVEKDLLLLTAHNFDQALRQHKHLLVYFYEPTSSDTHAVLLELSRAAAELRSQSSRIHLGKVDVSQEKVLTQELRANSPAMQFYESADRDHPTICPALRSSHSILTWLKRKTGRSAEVLKDLKQTETFLISEDVTVIGFFKDLHEGLVQVFYDVATDIPTLRFGVTKSKHVFNKYEMTKDTIALFKQTKKCEQYVMPDGISKEDVINFIRVNELDAVNEYNGTTSARILNSLVTNHALLFANKSEDSYEEISEAFLTVATELKGKMVFVLVDTNENRNGRILEFFRVRYIETPSVRTVNLTDNTQYQMQAEEVTVETVRAHCQLYMDGKAKPKLQSEPIPEDWDKKPVKELVGMNFEKVAFNENKNAFIMFYTPWCRKCQAAFLLWEKLAQVFEKHDSVVIARIDSAANDVNIILNEPYPSMKFFPAVLSEKVLPYFGEEVLEDLVEFVEEQVEIAKNHKEMEMEDRKKYVEEQKAKEERKDEL